MFSIAVVGYCPSGSFSYCLTMSQIVKRPTAAAVKASISTPVCAFVLTVTVTLTLVLLTMVVSTSTLVIGSGWQSGIKSLVLFAARIAAIFDVQTGSPLAV